MVSVNTVKSAMGLISRTAAHKPTQVTSFVRKYDPAIGEELTHRISGEKYFRPVSLHSKGLDYSELPKKLTEGGYESIPSEYFEALKKMKIYKHDTAYGRQVVRDDYKGAEYWANKNTLGETVATMQDFSSFGRRNIPTSLWEKIQSFFG